MVQRVKVGELEVGLVMFPWVRDLTILGGEQCTSVSEVGSKAALVFVFFL